jgi:hypothetical protein
MAKPSRASRSAIPLMSKSIVMLIQGLKLSGQAAHSFELGPRLPVFGVVSDLPF